MTLTAPAPFSKLLPELFPIISSHLPLSNRVPTLLALALTCHRIHDLIIPYLLSYNVRLVGDAQAHPVLKRFVTAATAVGEDGVRRKDDPFTGHSIHHLCIDFMPLQNPDACLTELQKLIDTNGLVNLASLTLHMENMLKAAVLPPTLWSSLKASCPNFNGIHVTGICQNHKAQWVQSEIFTIQGLTSIQLELDLDEYTPDTRLIIFDLSRLPSSLQTLELRVSDTHGYYRVDAAGSGLLSCVLPNLRSLILDWFDVGQPTKTKQFWQAHSGLERLELWTNTTGNWFAEFDSGMLPNLKFLKSEFTPARVLLPHIADSLVSLCLIDTYNAQAPYLLRTVPRYSNLPSLRSLGIQRKSGNSPKPFEGHRWREDENEAVTEAEPKKASRKFDGNYLMSVAKAAPNLEELELMGDSDDTLDAITASLSRMPKLHRLTISGPINSRNPPFFKSCYNWSEYADWRIGPIPENKCGKYVSTTFEQAAHGLANGCRTLDTVTVGNMIGDLLIKDGLSARIMREDDGGPVKEVRRIRAWGNIIGREEEW